MNKKTAGAALKTTTKAPEMDADPHADLREKVRLKRNRLGNDNVSRATGVRECVVQQFVEDSTYVPSNAELEGFRKLCG